MNEQLEFVVRAAAIGTGATAVMDLWGLFLKRTLAIPPLDYAGSAAGSATFRGDVSHMRISRRRPEFAAKRLLAGSRITRSASSLQHC
ncbi:hypothetical protein [Mesorhizobium sp.]|uniref:hypothetical protein n=1 Tax=Mesorhizobium sp. TaxID=1871066 RepID=UPI00258A1D5A|nr:hypothetical protein [Mesorhizobium sp.]